MLFRQKPHIARASTNSPRDSGRILVAVVKRRHRANGLFSNDFMMSMIQRIMQIEEGVIGLYHFANRNHRKEDKGHFEII